MNRKFMTCLMTGAIAASLALCAQAEEAASGASIDFEDGNMGFVAAYMQPADAAEIELSIVDYNGSKALQVKNLSGAVPYVAIDASSLLGADVAKVASIELSMGVSYEDGTFYACSGSLIAWSGEDLEETTDPWSVYLETSNPKTAVATLSEGEEFVADAGNMLVVQLKTDNGADEGAGNATLYLDDICFLDADGNVLAADTTAAFVENDLFAGNGPDYANLAALKNPVTFEGFACTGAGWAQAGFTMPQEFIDALVPGSVIEVEYSSGSGNMWVLMNEATAGWIRVGVGDVDGSGSDSSYYNSARNICQVTYEQLAAAYGEDVSTWGTTMQCESDADWEVFSVKVGQAASRYVIGTGTAVEFPDFACSGDGWAQNGFDMPQEIIDALVPGSVVEISYSSENDDLWIVMPGAAAGWSRVGVGNADGSGSDSAVCDGSKCYVTYEQIAAVCGEDKSTWGTTMQCEASGAWEVYGVKVGTAVECPMVKNPVEFEGFACSGDAWAQNGFDMPQEIIDALVPGAVVTVSYTSENGDLWLVMPGAAAGWSRVGVGNADGSGSASAACTGSVCQVTYEQIAAVCGEDVSTWGTTMQCEASGAWEVFGVSVGTR